MFAIDVAHEFEALAAELISSTGVIILEKNHRTQDSHRYIDLLVSWHEKEYACEIKTYRTRRAQISLIFAAAASLNMLCDELMIPGVLIVSSKVDSNNRTIIKNKFNIEVIDIEDLYHWGVNAGGLSDSLVSLMEINSEEIDSFVGRDVEEILNFENHAPESNFPANIRNENYELGNELITELSSIQRGKESWAEYELTCQKILNYLFKDELKGWHKQMSSSDELNRYDYVCRISGTTEFWSFLINNLKSRYVVFEFKNYTKAIKQNQIITTEKYLLENGLRKVALIICREGGDANSKKMIEGAMRESGKLIVVLNDIDIKEMISSRMSGGDASDYLFNKVDDFLLKLPR